MTGPLLVAGPPGPNAYQLYVIDYLASHGGDPTGMLSLVEWLSSGGGNLTPQINQAKAWASADFGVEPDHAGAPGLYSGKHYALLSRAYAISDTDAPIDGAIAPTDRGARFYALKAGTDGAAQVALAQTAREGAEAALAGTLAALPGITTRLDGVDTTLAAHAKDISINRGLASGHYTTLASVLARLSNLENSIAPTPGRIISATITAGEGTSSHDGAYIELKVAAADAGDTYVPLKGTLYLYRQGFDENANPTIHVDTFTVRNRQRQTAPNNALANETTVGGVTTIRTWIENFAYSTDFAVGDGITLLPLLVLEKGWYVKGGIQAPGQTLQLTSATTTASPPPFGTLITADRKLVGNSIYGELRLHHRNARKFRQVAGTIVTATDVNNKSVSTLVLAETPSPLPSWTPKVSAYCFTLNITSLATGLITLTHEDIPWIGGTASRRNTNTGTPGARSGAPKFFYKDVTLFNNPPVAYLDPAGNDSTGVCSTNAATAAASPFATESAARAKCNLNFGNVDGLQIRARPGTYTLTTLGAGTINNHTQKCARITYMADAAAGGTKENVIFQYGASGFQPKIVNGILSPVPGAAICFNNCTSQRIGTNTIGGTTGITLHIQYEDAIIDFGGYAFTYLSTSVDYYYYVEILNATNQAVGLGGNRHMMYRCVKMNGGGWFTASTSGNLMTVSAMKFGTILAKGQSCKAVDGTNLGIITSQASGVAGGAGTYNMSLSTNAASQDCQASLSIESSNVIACEFISVGNSANELTIPIDGCFMFNNIVWQAVGDAMGTPFGFGSNGDVNGFAYAQNFLHRPDKIEGLSVTISADSKMGNLTHVLDEHNTETGAYLLGRRNARYDETSAHVTGSVADNVLTVQTKISGANIGPGFRIRGIGIGGDLTITAQLTGPNGGTGTYQLNGSANIDLQDMWLIKPRHHKLCTSEANIFTIDAVKIDPFEYANHGDPYAYEYKGGHPHANAVGVKNNWWCYGGFILGARPEDYGPGSVPSPTQSQMNINDPGFIDNRAATCIAYNVGTSTATYAEGSGTPGDYGDWRIKSVALYGSASDGPARAIPTRERYSYDIVNTARAAGRNAAGAWA